MGKSKICNAYCTYKEYLLYFLKPLPLLLSPKLRFLSFQLVHIRLSTRNSWLRWRWFPTKKLLKYNIE